jgi:hypothetical protein
MGETMIISQLAFMFLIFIQAIIIIAAAKEKDPLLSGVAVIFSWFIFISASNVYIVEYSESASSFVMQACGYDFFGWLGFAMGIIMFVHLILCFVIGGGDK